MMAELDPVQESIIELLADLSDGKLTICRKDGQPISVIVREEIGEPVEVLEYGSVGNSVKALQALLNCHGQHLEVDGIFGALTQTALIIFQDQTRTGDQAGVCDLLTWQRLIGV